MNTRNTIQREMVLEAVQSLCHHPTAEEIYLAVAEKYPNISKGTVYRNLNLLTETGAIRKVAVPDAADRFDFHLAPHYHVKCTGCGRVFDVDMDYQEHLFDAIRDLHGFVMQAHDIVFQGICPQCNQ